MPESLLVPPRLREAIPLDELGKGQPEQDGPHAEPRGGDPEEQDRGHDVPRQGRPGVEAEEHEHGDEGGDGPEHDEIDRAAGQQSRGGPLGLGQRRGDGDLPGLVLRLPFGLPGTPAAPGRLLRLRGFRGFRGLRRRRERDLLELRPTVRAFRGVRAHLVAAQRALDSDLGGGRGLVDNNRVEELVDDLVVEIKGRVLAG